MAYATVQDVQDRMARTMTEDEQAICFTLLDDAAVIIDSYNANATLDTKKVVSCRMLVRVMGDGDSSMPVGASQMSMSGLGYSQSYTFGTGTNGEEYLTKLEKKLLGCGDKIGSYSPAEELVVHNA